MLDDGCRVGGVPRIGRDERYPEGMASEDQLCLLLARAQVPPEAERRAQELLSTTLDWSRILKLGRTHEVLPLLYTNLQRLGFAGVPEPVRTELTDTFASNALRNALLAKELARILRLLDDSGVRAIPLKGTALSESLYGDLALRVCADMDVLVPPKQVQEAFRLMESSGYQASFSEPALLELVARYGKDCGVLMRENGALSYPLQLHCGLIWGGPVERDLLEEIWSDAIRQTVHGVSAFALSADWEFLYFAVHAARHGLFPMKWLVDLDALCRRGTVNWESAKRKAARLEWQGAVQCSLGACAALLGTALPSAFAATGRAAPRGLGAPPSPELQIPREVLFAARLLQPRWRQLHFLALRLFVPTPADHQFFHLPRSLFLLYYLLRPLRLAFRVVGWLIQAGFAGLRLRFASGANTTN